MAPNSKAASRRAKQQPANNSRPTGAAPSNASAAAARLPLPSRAPHGTAWAAPRAAGAAAPAAPRPAGGGGGGWGRPGAGAAPADTSGPIATLRAMGFAEAEARDALTRHAWNVNGAIDWLLAGRPGAANSGGPAERRAPARAANPVEDFPALPPQPAPPAPAASAPPAPVAAAAAPASVPSAAATAATSVAGAPAAPMSPASGPAPQSPTAVPEADWEALLGARDTALEVGVGAGAPSVKMLGATSQAVGEASEAVFPHVRQAEVADAAATAPATDAPPGRLRRVSFASVEDVNTGVLGAEVGTFVRTWNGTETAHGWVYTEALDGRSKGWFPLTCLEEETSGREHRLAISAWSGEDLSVTAGDVLLVHVGTLTELGWIYAEVEWSADAQGPPKTARGGSWIPDFCLERGA
eukprot:TRINITY_DN14964_c0_g2_i2.p1 TRINITY_DN14964_c0_g2~~TRINITY_DN14964_c0_g2_i2.p1  ORF type:complete len:412 (+),score=64.06 TRINITY_DN14964_c0_g2_i2:222-1457(+)